jgi:hypothetical protein
MATKEDIVKAVPELKAIVSRACVPITHVQKSMSITLMQPLFEMLPRSRNIVRQLSNTDSEKGYGPSAAFAGIRSLQ